MECPKCKNPVSEQPSISPDWKLLQCFKKRCKWIGYLHLATMTVHEKMKKEKSNDKVV